MFGDVPTFRTSSVTANPPKVRVTPSRGIRLKPLEDGVATPTDLRRPAFDDTVVREHLVTSGPRMSGASRRADLKRLDVHLPVESTVTGFDDWTPPVRPDRFTTDDPAEMFVDRRGTRRRR